MGSGGTLTRNFTFEEAFHNVTHGEVFGWKLTPLTKLKIDSIACEYMEKIPILKLLSPAVATILLVKIYNYDREYLDEGAVEQVLTNLLSQIQETTSHSDLYVANITEDTIMQAVSVIQRAGLCWMARRCLFKRRRAAAVILLTRRRAAVVILGFLKQCIKLQQDVTRQLSAVKIQCVTRRHFVGSALGTDIIDNLVFRLIPTIFYIPTKIVGNSMSPCE